MKFAATEGMQAHNTGTFGFSAVQLSKLGATEYTLVTLVIDRSGSTAGFQQRMENCVKEVLKACQRSPRKDNLMLRYVTFEDTHTEVHGFKLLSECNPGDYDGSLPPDGMTALYDATVDGIEATANFGHDLLQNDYSVNGLVVVITDGMNNKGKSNMRQVKAAFAQAVKGENLESLQSILIGVVDKQDGSYQSTSDYLKQTKTEAGFLQYVELDDAKDTTIAKLAAFISKSVSSQSQALGTGGPSQAVTW